MKSCMITFRSVTPAQRGEGVLKRAGVDCHIQRTPRWMEMQGCGYSLHLSCEAVTAAVELLRVGEIPYRRVYRRSGSQLEEMYL